MNISCVICAELFLPSENVFITMCGHMFHHPCLMQWLQRSKTCPQCRNKCSDRNIHKVYFNLANLDTSRVDVGSLQQQLDNATLQLKIGEKDIQKSKNEIKDLKETQKRTMKTITGLESKLKESSFLIKSYNEQMKVLKADAKLMDDLRKEVKDLKSQIEAMNSLANILSSSQAEADKLLKSESDPKALSIWVSTLKRELKACELKRTDLRNTIKVMQNDIRKEQAIKQVYEERISLLESENYRLSEKIKASEEASALTTVPIPSELSAAEIPKLKRKATFDVQHTNSPGIEEKVQLIEDSDSPYLRIKSCSVPMLSTKQLQPSKTFENHSGILRNTKCDLSEKYSIFKKPRLMGATSSNPNLVFNGMGGSEKRQYESNENKMKPTSVPKLSSRLKVGKLSRFHSAGSKKTDEN